jgi:hypothetical protein
MCDIPSTAVFCSESIECFIAVDYKLFCKPFVTIWVALIITPIIINFIFHIRCISTRIIIIITIIIIIIIIT